MTKSQIDKTLVMHDIKEKDLKLSKQIANDTIKSMIYRIDHLNVEKLEISRKEKLLDVINNNPLSTKITKEKLLKTANAKLNVQIANKIIKLYDSSNSNFLNAVIIEKNIVKLKKEYSELIKVKNGPIFHDLLNNIFEELDSEFKIHFFENSEKLVYLTYLLIFDLTINFLDQK